MQYVAYIEIPARGEKRPQRWYLQEFGSFGYSEDYYETPDYRGPICTLDSRCLRLNTPKQAIDLLTAFRDTDPTHRTSTFGFHGITENGNACAPFQTVFKGEDLHQLHEKLVSASRMVGQWSQALLDLGIPNAWSWAPTAVGRKGVLLPYQVREMVQHHIENQVSEDEDVINKGLENVIKSGWMFTEVHIDEHVAFVHMSRIRDDKEQHACAIIFALNLMSDKAITEVKEAQNAWTE